MTGEVLTVQADWSITAGLLLYLLIVLTVGFLTYRYMRSLDDFVLGGRRLGPWVTAISERASGESAWFLLGLPGAAYALGFTSFWSVIGIALGILFSWTFLAGPLRKATGRLGALTIPDFFEARFGDKTHFLRIVSTQIIIIFYTLYIAAQFVGAGKILNAIYGIDPRWGMVIGGCVVVFYTLMGGFLAVAWTDLFQGLLMATVAVAIPIIAIVRMGGPGRFVETMTAQGTDFVSMSGGKFGQALLFGTVIGGLSWGFGYLGQPHLLTRYMAIRNARETRKGRLIAMGWVLCAYWGAAFIGLTAVSILGSGLADPEQVMPLMTKALFPGWLAGLVISGAIAAMMSTADSQLLVSTSAFVQDVYARLVNRNAKPEYLVRLSRELTLLIASVSLFLAFFNEELIFSLVEYAWTGLGSSFGPPLLLALHWKKTTRWGVLSGMLGGYFSTILWKNAAGLNELLDLKLATFLISLLLTLSVSLLTRKVGAGRQETEYP
jgi:sodium/proline symporter